MSAPAPGLKLGPYELLTPIGAGGMGEVWKARDPRLDRIVAIKFSQAQFTDRFQREARAIAEYVEGEHRDLKPDNSLVTGAGRVKILDFGLAKQTLPQNANEATRTIAVTNTGSIVGTAAYMSPEQPGGDQQLDARSDQFSFGLILYESATGTRAFQRPSTPETLAAIIRDEPAPLPATVPAPLRWTIHAELKAMPAKLSEVSAVMARQPTARALDKRFIAPVITATAGIALAWSALSPEPASPIAYVESNEGVSSLMAKAADGATPAMVLVRNGNFQSLSWSADNERVCHSSTASSRRKVCGNDYGH